MCHWQKYIINILRDLTVPFDTFKNVQKILQSMMFSLTYCIICSLLREYFSSISIHTFHHMVLTGCFYWFCLLFAYMTCNWLGPKNSSLFTHMPTLKYGEKKTCYNTSFTPRIALLAWDWWEILGWVVREKSVWEKAKRKKQWWMEGIPPWIFILKYILFYTPSSVQAMRFSENCVPLATYKKPKSSCSWLSLLPLSHSHCSNHTKFIAISLPLNTHLASVMFFRFLFSITSSKRSFLIIFYKITHPHLVTVYTLFISLFFVSLSFCFIIFIRVHQTLT